MGFRNTQLPQLVGRLLCQQVGQIFTQIVACVDVLSRRTGLRAPWFNKQSDERGRNNDLIAVTHRCAATVLVCISCCVLGWQQLVFTRYYSAYVIL